MSSPDSPDPRRPLPEHLYQPLPARELDVYGASVALDLGGAWTVLVTIDNLRIRAGYIRAFGWDASGSAPPARAEVRLRIRRVTSIVAGYDELPGDTVGTRQLPAASMIPVSPNETVYLEARDTAPAVNRAGTGRVYGWWE